MNPQRFLVPKHLRDEIEKYPDGHELLTRVVVAVTLRMSALVVIPLFIALGLAYHEAKNRTSAINESRAVITYTQCLTDNDRHDRALSQLDTILRERKAQIRHQIKIAVNPALAEELRQSLDRLDDARTSNAGLIEAVVPFQNCEQLIVDRFGKFPDSIKTSP